MKAILVLILLAAAGWFGYDSMVLKPKQLDDLDKKVTRLQEDNAKLTKQLEMAKNSRAGGTQVAGTDSGGNVGIRASAPAVTEVTSRTIECYFCSGFGKYQAKLGSRLSQSPCVVCKGAGQRTIKVPSTGNYSICGGQDDRSTGGGNQGTTCAGMGFLAVKRDKSKKVGGGTISIARSPDGTSRYSSQACTRCQGKGIVRRAGGEQIR